VGSSVKKASLPLLGLALVMALLAAVPVALATEGETEISRDEYVAKVEPICAANTKSNSRILKGVKQQVVKRHQLVPAGRRFIKASSVFGRTVKRLAAVPRPASDQPRLTRWLKYLAKEHALLHSIGKALKANSKNRAYRLASQLTHNTNQAKNTVISFGFKACKLDQSRFI